VIGYDQRLYSEEFAKTTASVLIGNEIKVFMFDKIVPTPLLAFSITELGCDGGIMITASHNPKGDNGYKVYSRFGCQIISPTDKNITARMKEILKLKKVEEIKIGNIENIEIVKAAEIYNSYLKHLPEINRLSLPRIAYTPVHGVGWSYISRMAPFLIPTPKQTEPDGHFPTVKFPNPEEGKNTLELAIELANKEKAPLIMANDPDVDRFALAEKSDRTLQWKIFTGNEIAAMFIHFLWSEHKKANPNPRDCYILTTSVSSRLVKKMAQVEGFNVEATFTGFKNIGNLANSLYSKGKTVIFAFEESIGFMIGKIAWEKDGISSLNLACRIAELLYMKRKMQFIDYLEEIYNKNGWCYQKNSYYYISQNSNEIAESVFKQMREKLQVIYLFKFIGS
jgi:phosphomannomutase